MIKYSNNIYVKAFLPFAWKCHEEVCDSNFKKKKKNYPGFYRIFHPIAKWRPSSSLKQESCKMYRENRARQSAEKKKKGGPIFCLSATFEKINCIICMEIISLSFEFYGHARGGWIFRTIYQIRCHQHLPPNTFWFLRRFQLLWCFNFLRVVLKFVLFLRWTF